MTDLIFGPVPSRRLGRSLGINHIPFKYCSYSCVYCQLKRTPHLTITPQSFFPVSRLVEECKQTIQRCENNEQTIDTLTLVADGEPTLDSNLGSLITALQEFGYPVAVITNASLLWVNSIQEALHKAQWVSVKIDSTDEKAWKRINRPHGHLNLTRILESILKFADNFQGVLVTETMMVQDINDSELLVQELGDFLKRVKPSKSYISAPTRPPAEDWVKPPTVERLNAAYQQLKQKGIPAEFLIHYEGDDFTTTGDPIQDLLSITAVHPMRKEAVEKLLSKIKNPQQLLDMLIEEEKIVYLEHNGETYYLRGFHR